MSSNNKDINGVIIVLPDTTTVLLLNSGVQFIT
jgi:hypothetical protein